MRENGLTRDEDGGKSCSRDGCSTEEKNSSSVSSLGALVHNGAWRAQGACLCRPTKVVVRFCVRWGFAAGTCEAGGSSG